ncbi:hypothetical protein BCN_4979 [Bacillus cereus NC7401]|nr:hypothetical protein BCN_4979 [Bacillus cereus NC7401]
MNLFIFSFFSYYICTFLTETKYFIRFHTLSVLRYTLDMK